MNDFEKAKAYIVDKNNSLPEASKKLGIPLSTLKAYRSEPEKLRTAAWNRVNEIAGLYRSARQKTRDLNSGMNVESMLQYK